MEAAVIPVAEQAVEPISVEQELFDLVAYELWKRASCPEAEADQDVEEPEAWCHPSCL